MKKIIASMVFAVSAMILVSGCSSSDSTPAPSTLNGTAATGAPIDGIVFVKDAKGVDKSIATAADGSFTLDVPDMTPPYLLKIMPSSGPELYSYASQNGQTVNLTPATNLAMFLAYGKQDLNTLYVGWDGSGVAASEVATAESTVRANLKTQMEANGLDVAGFNLFSTAFNADSSGIDAVLDNLKVTIDAGARNFTFTDSNDNDLGFDPSLIAPTPAPANAIMITTVSGGQHALNGVYSTVCYSENGADGRIDSVTVNDGFEWINRSMIYTGDLACASAISKTGSVLATITKGSDKQITGWNASMGGAPDRADGNGQLSDTETVTAFTLTDFVIEDPDNVLVGLSLPSSVTGFYVFDDTGAGIKMYRDRDGNEAGKSDPYVNH